MKFETRTLSILIVPENGSILAENSTEITITDEGAGEYVEVSQMQGGKIAISPEEWPEIRDGIQRMILNCLPEKP